MVKKGRVVVGFGLATKGGAVFWAGKWEWEFAFFGAAPPVGGGGPVDFFSSPSIGFL